MKVSACCISYNQVDFIEKALEGMLAQKVDFDYEIVIHDDGSTDGTAEIIDDYRERYPHIIRATLRPVNIGMSANLYSCLADCSGDYIAFCEGDDFWVDANKLKRQKSLLDRFDGCSFCYHDVHVSTRLCESIGNDARARSETKSRLVDINELSNGNFINTSSVLVRRAALSEVLANVGSLILNDFSIFLFALRKGPAYYLDSKMAVYRSGIGHWSTLNEKDKYIRWIEELIELQKHFIDLPEVRARLFKSILAHARLLSDMGHSNGAELISLVKEDMGDMFQHIVCDYLRLLDQTRSHPSLKKLIYNCFSEVRRRAIRRLNGK